jgi:hypothetical protein
MARFTVVADPNNGKPNILDAEHPDLISGFETFSIAERIASKMNDDPYVAETYAWWDSILFPDV